MRGRRRAADFNHDGILDIVAGPYIYYGPDYTKSREIFLTQAHGPSREYASDCMVQGAADMTGDGWPDVVCSNLGNAGLSICQSQGRIAPLGQIPGGAAHQQRDHCAPGYRWRRRSRAGLRGGWLPALRQAGPRQTHRALGGPHHFGTGHGDRARHRGGRHQRRRTHGYRQRVRLVGAAAGGQQAGAVDVPSAGVRHVEPVLRRGRRADGGLRRERRRPERRGDRCRRTGSGWRGTSRNATQPARSHSWST